MSRPLIRPSSGTCRMNHISVITNLDHNSLHVPSVYIIHSTTLHTQLFCLLIFPTYVHNILVTKIVLLFFFFTVDWFWHIMIVLTHYDRSDTLWSFWHIMIVLTHYDRSDTLWSFWHIMIVLTHYDHNCTLVFSTLKMATSGQNMSDDTM